jgi:hypothetical protein
MIKVKSQKRTIYYFNTKYNIVFPNMVFDTDYLYGFTGVFEIKGKFYWPILPNCAGDKICVGYNAGCSLEENINMFYNTKFDESFSININNFMSKFWFSKTTSKVLKDWENNPNYLKKHIKKLIKSNF